MRPSHTQIVVSSAVGASLWLYYFIKAIVRNNIIERTTVLYDLEKLGVPRSGKRIQGTAVICGGSVAGLFAARICADHFEDVLIIEPETWTASEDGRRPIYDIDGKLVNGESKHARTRVFQYEQFHGFQPITLMALRRLSSNADEEFENTNARIRPAILNNHVSGVMVARVGPSDYPDNNMPSVYFSTRDAFERTLRRLVCQTQNRIRFLSGTVTSIHRSSNDPRKIESVSVRQTEGSADDIVNAALVVDCTGGSQAGFKWIKRWQADHSTSLGPPVDDCRISYHPKMRYMTFKFPVSPGQGDSFKIPGGYKDVGYIYVFFPRPPGEYRTVAIARVEGERISIACGGWGDPDLPQQPSEIVSWIRSFNATVPVPEWVLDMIESLRLNEEKVEIADTKIPACSWIRYENVADLPSNFVSTGDAMMRVNPIYGQGCSKAGVGAVVLDKVLRTVKPSWNPELPDNFSSLFFKEHSNRMAPLWYSTKPTDYAWDTTTPAEGETHDYGSWSRAYGGLLTELEMRGDKLVNSTYWSVRNFVAPPADLYQPMIVIKALFLAFGKTIGFA